MRYLLALTCPPAALWACHRRWRAGLSLILWLAGLLTFRWGIGVLLLFGAMLWAIRAVGDDRAAAISARFIRTVRPTRPARG